MKKIELGCHEENSFVEGYPSDGGLAAKQKHYLRKISSGSVRAEVSTDWRHLPLQTPRQCGDVSQQIKSLGDLVVSSFRKHLEPSTVAPEWVQTLTIAYIRGGVFSTLLFVCYMRRPSRMREGRRMLPPPRGKDGRRGRVNKL
jgi:hypothetical protein